MLMVVVVIRTANSFVEIGVFGAALRAFEVFCELAVRVVENVFVVVEDLMHGVEPGEVHGLHVHCCKL
jgi:hypothetical protein